MSKTKKEINSGGNLIERQYIVSHERRTGYAA